MRNLLQTGFAEASQRKEVEFEALKASTRGEIKSVVDKSESSLQLFLDSDVIHFAAAGNTMDLLEMLLELLPASERSKALNGFDRLGLTPLMVVASITPSAGISTGRRIMETLINMGADKNIVHASQGLSALGQFRSHYKASQLPRILFGLQQPSSEVQDEVSRIEALLRPVNGPTPEDDAQLNKKSEADSDGDF
jgi:hypothetical protein